MSEDKEPFLARWSRIKSEARQRESDAKPIPPVQEGPKPGASVAATSAPAASPELPPVDSLQGLASEYREFLHPQVDETLRHAALKKLFSDPHFNTMDGLDVYIDDYSKADPIPEAMLRMLEQAKGLVFDTDAKRGDGETPTAEQASASPPPGVLQGPDTTVTMPGLASADDQSSGTTSEPAPEPIRNAKT